LTDDYKCGKCGNVYSTKEEALECESHPVTPFKYEIGDTVLFEFESKFSHKRYTIRAVVAERWIRGLSQDDKPAHGNVYKLRIIEKDKGLIAVRPEDQIIAKIE